MSQFQTDKFNVAWFKLAEFVTRKEKERALGIYRLLIYSLPHQALAAQLEGDLLLAFNDEKAIHSYVKAAHLYEQEGQLQKAAAVYEHCITLLPNSLTNLINAIKLYSTIDHTARVHCHTKALINALVHKGQMKEALQLINDLLIEKEHKTQALESFVFQVLTIEPWSNLLEKPVKQIIENYSELKSDSKGLTLFMSTLLTLSNQAHGYAVMQLSK